MRMLGDAGRFLLCFRGTRATQWDVRLAEAQSYGHYGLNWCALGAGGAPIASENVPRPQSASGASTVPPGSG
eukprot:8829891-Pyramimonas_sp.AAC.2